MNGVASSIGSKLGDAAHSFFLRRHDSAAFARMLSDRLFHEVRLEDSRRHHNRNKHQESLSLSSSKEVIRGVVKEL